MSPIVATVDVQRLAEEVFAYATDPTRFWQPPNRAASAPPRHRDRHPRAL